MKVMVSNNSKSEVHYLSGKYPNIIGHLYSPGGQRGPYKWIPYALDNGRFACWSNNAQWSESNFMKLIDWASIAITKPEWVVVPDIVADRDRTLKEWDRWIPTLQSYRWPLAMAVQDGMTWKDVPNEAEVVFIGGSTAWKWGMLEYWTERKNKRIHVARVNGWERLWRCADAGAESCDGTGWFRGDQYQLAGLYRFLAEQAGERERIIQPSLMGDIHEPPTT